MRLHSDLINTTVKLTPKAYDLEEIVILPKYEDKELVIGKFRKSKVDHSFGVNLKPWIVARFFDYKAEYKETQYLNKIRLVTNSDIKDAKFNIRLYSMNENGEPDDFIYDKNIIGIAKKGKHITEIDLSNLNIRFPKEGFFVAVEWFIIESNKYEYEYVMVGKNKKYKGISYEPSIGSIPKETDENGWVFMNGKWKRIWKNERTTMKKYKNKYNLIAIELTLTN